MQLCRICDNLNIQQCRKEDGLLAIYRFPDLEKGASHGCSFCYLLCHTLEKQIETAKPVYRGTGCLYLYMLSDGLRVTKNASAGLQINQLVVSIAQGYWGMSPRLLFGPDGESNDMYTARQTYRVMAGINSKASKLSDVIGTYLGDNLLSSNHVAAIQEWLISCLENHSDCCKRASGEHHFDARDVPLPSRCLDIKDPANVKLKETRGERGAYVALSHRWGSGTASCSTTTENIESRKESLDTAILPRIFRDVIHFTRLLGIQYLWIDSLCILQAGDDGEDWKHEALLMGQYYQYSLITVAVATPPNDPAGCFPARPSGLNGLLARLPYVDWQGRKDGFVYVQERHGSVHDEYRSTVLHSELLSRGWVLQEWLLSRRLVFITPTQLYFECQSKWPRNEYMETAHLGLEAGQISGRIHDEWKVPLKSLFSYKTKPIGDLWCTIVETYCTLQLTKPKLDTFIAIAGIADEIKRMMSQEAAMGDSDGRQRDYYVAGLWLADIHHGLLWEQRTRLGMARSGCSAPTWSWASQSMPTKWQARGKRVENACEVRALILEDGRTFELGSSHEGQVDEPHNGTAGDNDTTEHNQGSEEQNTPFGVTNSFTCLRIRGQMRPFLIGRQLTPEETTKISEYTGGARNFAGMWRAVSDTVSPNRHLGWASIESASVNRQLGDDSNEMSNSILLQAFHVAKIRGESGGIKFGKLGRTHSVCCVLFINPIAEGRYERVGTGRIFQSEYFNGVQEEELELV